MEAIFQTGFINIFFSNGCDKNFYSVYLKKTSAFFDAEVIFLPG